MFVNGQPLALFEGVLWPVRIMARPLADTEHIYGR